MTPIGGRTLGRIPFTSHGRTANTSLMRQFWGNPPTCLTYDAETLTRCVASYTRQTAVKFETCITSEATVDLAEIGERIRAARKERGWTQSRLAIAANASRARIDAIENGRAADFGVRGLLQMLQALNLDLAIGPENRGRPTLEDLTEELQNAPRMGR